MVVGAFFFVHDVDEDGAVVHDDPSAFLGAVDGVGEGFVFFLQGFFDVVDDGFDLGIRLRGADEEKFRRAIDGA